MTPLHRGCVWKALALVTVRRTAIAKSSGRNNDVPQPQGPDGCNCQLLMSPVFHGVALLYCSNAYINSNRFAKKLVQRSLVSRKEVIVTVTC